MEGTVQEDDYLTKVRFIDKNLLKTKVFASSGSQRLGSGPKSGSGLNRWHQSGETDPRLVAGSDPDCVTTNQDRDTTYVGTGPDQLPLANNGKEKWPMLLDRKDRPHTNEHI